jgi:hypothetical protein
LIGATSRARYRSVYPRISSGIPSLVVLSQAGWRAKGGRKDGVKIRLCISHEHLKPCNGPKWTRVP